MNRAISIIILLLGFTSVNGQSDNSRVKFDLSGRYRFELWNRMNAKNYGDVSPAGVGKLNDKILYQRVITELTFKPINKITIAFHLQDSRAFGWSLRAVTVVDKATNRAVRVTPKAEAMLNNKKTAFFTDYRMLGKPASTVPAEIVDPLVTGVMNAPDDKLLNISSIFEYKLEPKKDSFDGFVCEECGEMTVMEYGRIKGDKKVCIDCAAK